MNDVELVSFIRETWARETGAQKDYPFGWASWKVEGDVRDTDHARSLGQELADAMLLELFKAERPYCESDLDTVLVMCHG
jgi:hypothetical protein